ncbi:transketolase [Candidatus Micrarchaeota archaeon]|nr:MAG: transketolase [Candidatus Micrarchaeota archaeon]
MSRNKEIEQRVVDTIRVLSAEAVQKAKSGHPGMPMGAADIAVTLWAHFLKHCPEKPKWPDRDRFVLSAGHASMLLYSLLYLFGYDLTLDDIKQFRQWESKTPGHPEYDAAPGIETTTGPLGQGFGNAVGMALAERMLASRFNTDRFPIFSHYTYVLASDGDIMEGVASEAASLAGHLALGSLIVLYDDNKVTIEGSTDLAFSEDVGRRFEAYGWHVQRVDGHNREEIASALQKAREVRDKPSIVICRTHIAYGAPTKQDTASAHGEPLGEEELRKVKEKFGFDPDKDFEVPAEVIEWCRNSTERGRKAYKRWEAMLQEYKREEPQKASLLERLLSGEVPQDLEKYFPTFEVGKAVATRAASGTILNAIAQKLPELVGGSADLGPSTKTLVKGGGDVARGRYECRNLRFGIREHAMGAMLNGMALHGGLIPYGSTFLVFSDYMRPPIRLAAMMGLRVIYVFTHDSIFVGEDGPTHQPVEHLSSLRAVPNLDVLRPADASETAYAWFHALRRREGPTAICLTRQGVPVLDRSKLAPASGLLKGAYVISDEDPPLDWILIGTGSEVSLCLKAAEILRSKGKKVRVVSMPSWEIFLRQEEAYRREVLPEGPRRAVVEAGVRHGWDRFGGPDGLYFTVERFGASAPYKVLAEKFAFTPESIAERILEA